MTVRSPIARRVVLTLLSGALLVSCGGDDEVPFAATEAWSRPTPAGATNGVLYLTVSSDVADELVGVEVPGSIADHTELHATTGTDGQPHEHGGGGDDGLISMTEVSRFPIGKGGTVVFEPGGSHVMLVDLATTLVDGDSYTATLDFASGRTLAIEVLVADNAPE